MYLTAISCVQVVSAARPDRVCSSQRVLTEVEKYKRQKWRDSNEVYYRRLKKLDFEEDRGIKEKMTISNGFKRETIYLWKKVGLAS